MKRIVTALAAVLSLTLAGVLGGASAALAAPAATTCSTAFLDGDSRLGPATTPDSGIVALELIGYDRLDGLSPQQFLARYYNSATSSWDYPPDNGYLIVNGRPVEFQTTLGPGQSVDRFGSPGGSFLAPFGIPYAARSLPPSNLDDQQQGLTCNYYTYKVLKPFAVEAGPIAPAFGQPGLGLQYQLVSTLLPGDPVSATVNWLVSNGYLAATN